MPQSITPKTAYQTLLRDIRAEMERGIRKVEELFERQKVLSHWAIGRKINAYFKTHQPPRGTIGQFYLGMAKDLDMNNRTLEQCEQFFRYFPKLETHPNLKWSHYRFLLVEPDPAKREAWIRRIKKEKIPADQLRLILMPASKNEGLPDIDLKNPVRGKLYTYRILRAQDIDNFDVPWFVDLGFAARKEAPDSKGALNNKYFYASEKTEGEEAEGTEGPEGPEYRLKAVNAKAEELFTFHGILRRVIDGDTLLVAIDQGFSYWNEQRLRLKGIDAPELDTLAGQRAKKWLEDELKHSKHLVVKTYKTDQWDRYLVDAFYLPKEKDMALVAAQGVWLNGRMVEEGIAKIWKA
ncbi:MAG: thermonuclease family protein [Candidatus Omnitrophota bacterium]|nr:thermonuclease family protein [Candidatus Omnitrophota bacterium]